MTTDATTHPSDPAVTVQEQKEKVQDSATASLEAQIEDLEVSKPESKADIHEEHQQQQQQDEGVKAVTEQVDEDKLETTEDSKQDASSEGESSTHTSDDEGDGPKELGLVISALQSTIKQNQEKAQPVEQEKHDGDKPVEQKEEEEEEEELHSVGRSSVDDNNSVTTSTTNVSQEEDKAVVEDPNMPSTFEEIVQDILPPTPGVAPQRQTFDFGGRASEDMGDVDTYSANLIALNKIDMKEIKANTLSPRQQERADEPVLRAIRHLFNNRFMKAKKLFEKQAETDPLHALGLGSMAFLKAIMTSDESMTKNAIDVLTTTYSIASAQIDAATKKTVGNSVYQAMSSYYNYIKFARGSGGLPASPKPATLKSIQKDGVTFVPNGVLRAHVAKAECCLQIAILQLLQENVMGYIKCGMNLRRAYASYSLVWQEYKRMGQIYHDFVDRDTISGIQFGIGAVHLVLSTLPQKVLRIVSAFGWKADKHLGFALLKLCVEERRIRSPMASLMLLAYYTVLTSLCPQILSNEYTQPAIETLLDAQRTYPNSAFFLYFAGRTSRLARNLTLSTQSFTYAIEISKSEWAEVEVLHACSYEIGYNYMMEHNWEEAAKVFDMLYKERYWSPAIFRYLTGACLDMMGQRTEAILAFAEVPELVGSKTHSTALTEKYVLRKVTAFQECGYQDMDMALCALEYLCLFTGFDFMNTELLEGSLDTVDHALDAIMEAEKTEFGIRTRELLPETPAPKYFDQRGALLLIKASLFNAMGRFKEAIIHLNWIIDHKEQIEVDKWIVPFAYWEAGVTAWGMDNKTRSRSFWESALRFSKFDFEYRLAMRVNLAITKAEEMGVPKPADPNPANRHKAEKKEPIITLDSIQSRQSTSDDASARLSSSDHTPAAEPTVFKVHV
ncbi:hypothetical protein V8B55DRAFT_1499570 [Mucor lusitanicus]|uniref:Tetratricopeptide repeat protein 39C n=1 Tax=Mucor circinelloides f. lusitanicus TaxID=29924 RepID=A0A8H4BLS3_MUCCL|nr:hypothetical protein FB192DRAFT_1358155 [Mucor lusitanicus]